MALSIKGNPEHKQELTVMLTQCFHGLNLYGKEPEQFKSINAMFQMALSDYPIENIRKAMIFYIKNYSSMPTPSDIVNIIERGNKPMFCKDFYRNLCKKDPWQRTSEEWQYLADYEKYQKTGKH